MYKMKKLNFLFFSLLVSVISYAQSYSGPESVEYDAVGDRYFIANSNNGEIIARDNNGNLTVFVSGLVSGPYGMEIVGNTLYACDGSRIKGFDLSNGSQVANVNLGATFLNGITHKGTDLFITDFSAKKVYRLNTTNNAFNVYITGLTKSPNGIIYDDINDRLVMVNWGTNAPIYEINLSDSTYTTLTTTSLGNCDGIAMNCSGQFYVASWSPTRISRFDGDFVAAPVNMNVTGLSSPADIFYNQVEDTLAIPNSGNNTVKFVQYSDCLSLGVKEEKEVTYSIYPNPANNLLSIIGNFNNTKVEICNAIGQRIYSNKINNSNLSIDISDFDNGIYFVNIDNKIEKLIIQR